MTGFPIYSRHFRPGSGATSPKVFPGGRSNVWLRAVKDTVDLSVAAIGLLVLLPVFAVIALAIALDSPGDIFYKQPRLGRHGQVFALIKFRTMYQNADRVLEELLRDDRLKEEWRDYQKLREDPRITRTGRWLRKLGLDELPQLWNVLQGEMSMVGPRPIMPNQRNLYGPGYAAYVQVSPGITGLWQVSGGNRLSFARRAELDTEYVLHWSVRKDLEIALRTFKVVLTQDGLY